MKIVILFFIVILVLFLFRLLKNKTINLNKQHKNTDEKIIDLAINATYKDVLFHYENIELNSVIYNIQTSRNELAIFLYRFGYIFINFL